MLAPEAGADSRYSEDEVAKLAGLGVAELRSLALYDVLSAGEGVLSYTDLVVARAVGRLSAEGARFPEIVSAALEQRLQRGGSPLGVRTRKCALCPSRANESATHI